MNFPPAFPSSRREFLRATGRFAAVSALAGITLPYVHGQESSTPSEMIQLALIGCGGRGTGAVQNALAVTGSSIGILIPSLHGSPVRVVPQLGAGFRGAAVSYGF